MADEAFRPLWTTPSIEEGFLFRMSRRGVTTYGTQAADPASGTAGDTDRPAVMDEAVAEVAALFGRNNLPQLPLHFARLMDIIHKSDQIAQTDTMSIGDNSGFSEHIPHNQVCAFPPDSGEGEYFLKTVRNISPIPVAQYFHAGGNIPGFASAKTAGTHDLLYFFNVCFSKCVDGRKLFIQLRSDLVHPLIRTLCCKPHTDQKLPGILIGQRAVCIGIFCFQFVYDSKGQFFFMLLLLFTFSCGSFFSFL